MKFSELKHEAELAKFHLTLYAEHSRLRVACKKTATQCESNAELTKRFQESLDHRRTAKAHLEQYNLIMVHLNSLFPARGTYQQLFA